MPQTLQLFISHLSRNNLLTLKVFLELTKTDEAAVWEYTDNPETAAAVLIDADSEEGNLALENWAGKKNQRPVVIAFSGRTDGFPEDVLVLPRPLRSVELIPLLRQAGQRFSQIVQEQPAPAVAQVAQPKATNEKPATAEVDASPKQRRVAEMLRAHPHQVFKIIDQVMRPVIFDIGHRHYYAANLVGMEVGDLLAAPTDNLRIEELNHSQLAKETRNLKAQDLDAPLWTAALAISNGQLLGGLSLTEFYRLSRWPDFKKLGQDPLHLRLTALLRRGGTIDYFADTVKAPVGEVVAFINACHALDYLDTQEQAAVPERTRDTPSNAAKRGLFGRIRRRLGI